MIVKNSGSALWGEHQLWVVTAPNWKYKTDALQVTAVNFSASGRRKEYCKKPVIEQCR